MSLLPGEDLAVTPPKLSPNLFKGNKRKSCADCKGFCLFSGGKDSMVVAHEMEKAGRLAGCIFIDTTCKSFVEEECAKQGWPLHVVSSEMGYRDFIIRYGFPSVSFHHQIMQTLKYHALRIFRREYYEKNKEAPLLFSGIRKFESARRFLNASYDLDYFDGCYWEQPIRLFSTEVRNKKLAEYKATINPVYKVLHYSGECICGSFSSREEIDMIDTFYPRMAAYIRDLEEDVKKYGSKIARRHSSWGNNEGFTDALKQNKMENFVDQMVCANCYDDQVMLAQSGGACST